MPGYYYDGNGTIVKSVIGGVVTYYGSPAYQVKTDGTRTNTRKYYAFGNSTIAMRENGVLTWLLSDQVNSTTVTATENGEMGSEIRYTAFGETRWVNGVTVTDQRYTGQREEVEIGLYYYVARWYDPYLNHFIQADTVVPNQWGLLSYLKYAYVNFNPIRLSDPSGHYGFERTGGIKNINGIEFVGAWSIQEKYWVINAAKIVASNLSKDKPSATYKKVYGINEKNGDTQKFTKGLCVKCNGRGMYTSGPRDIWVNFENGFFTTSTRTQDIADQLNIHTVTHELGHAFRSRLIYTAGGDPDTEVTDAKLVEMHKGYAEFTGESLYWEPNNQTISPSETIANQFLGWNYDTWADDDWGTKRRSFMNEYMPIWIDMIVNHE